MSAIGAPAPRPCASCPYRTDVPSGIWDASEYAKLPAYDRPTMEQPPQLFLCHQHDRGSEHSRVCGGWAGCHDGDELLALRFALIDGRMAVEAAKATINYRSPVPLFPSGAAAAEHGLAEITRPGSAAAAAMRKIGRQRGNTIQYG